LSVKLIGDSYAAGNLGLNYFGRYGVEKDFERATFWSIFAAKLGNGTGVDTLYKLISSRQAVFKSGYGPLDSFDAIILVRRLAESGDTDKQAELANILERSGGLTEAIVWYRRAAENGNSDARRALVRLTTKKPARTEDRPTGP
jgi:hypothetical protein